MTDHRFETPRPVQLYVELGAGTIVVAAHDTAESQVEISGREAERAVVELDGDHLVVVGPKDRAGFGGSRKLDVTITVPTDSLLKVKAGSADVSARGRFAATHVKSGSGDVSLAVIAGPGQVETGSGDITIDDAEQELRVKSGSGDVSVERVGAAASISTGSGDVRIGSNHGPAVVKTGSGDLKVVEAATDVTLSTGSGDLTIGTARRGRVTAKGASGDVQVGIPGGTPVWTDVSTVTGRIRSDLTGAGQPEDGADYVELRAKTVSGDIVLTEK